ncbi:MAG: ABC transporter ATP-binding protein [Bacillota bacterium]|nr:MAG: ABC transporter ATP-binding protein [Bacillota bacterium]
MSRDLRELLSLMAPYRWRYLGGIAALLLTDLLQLIIPQLLGRVADDLEAGRLDLAGIGRYAGWIAVLAVAIAGLRWVWRQLVFGSARRVEYDLRRRLFAHLQKLTPEFYHRHKTGDLMALATNDVQAVRSASGEGVLMGADAILLSTATLVVMLAQVDWRLVLLGLSPLPLLALFALWFGRVMHERHRRVQEVFGDLSEVVQENAAGIRVVKAFAQEEAQIDRFTRENRRYQETYLRMARVHALIDPLISLLAGLGFFVILGYGSTLVLAGRVSLGDLVAFNSYLGMMVWPMLAFGFVINIIQRGTAAVRRLREIFQEAPTVADAPDAQPLPQVRGEIEVRNLTFRYRPNLPPALEGVSFHIRPGEILGIIGRTGSGKSTLANLLVRLWDPPPGTVFIDGRDICTVRLRDLRQAIAYVPQEAFLFSMTIAENIAFDAQEHSLEEIRAAAALAQVDSDIMSFPRGYDTLLGERGITLSGGQRQRVGIARALMRQAPILILDDCLSAVDAATEARLLQELKGVMAGRTTIIISHRVAAVAHADHILVLDQGRVVEQGRHEELLERRGLYWQLYQLQQLEAAIAAEA